MFVQIKDTRGPNILVNEKKGNLVNEKRIKNEGDKIKFGPKSFMSQSETIHSINSRIDLKIINKERYLIRSYLHSYRYYVDFISRGLTDQILINKLRDLDLRAIGIKSSLHVYFRKEVNICAYEAEEYPEQYINKKMGFSLEDRQKFRETISYYNNERLELNLCNISHTMGNADYMFEKICQTEIDIAFY
jgi:hypothetical protein